MVFLFLGKPASEDLQGRLTAESAENNNDILLEDFCDTYLNLTLKTTFMLKWAATGCPKAGIEFFLQKSYLFPPPGL
jgi:Galactosyltransferase